jgi:hypothetical protein
MIKQGAQQRLCSTNLPRKSPLHSCHFDCFKPALPLAICLPSHGRTRQKDECKAKVPVGCECHTAGAEKDVHTETLGRHRCQRRRSLWSNEGAAATGRHHGALRLGVRPVAELRCGDPRAGTAVETRVGAWRIWTHASRHKRLFCEVAPRSPVRLNLRRHASHAAADHKNAARETL